MDEGNKRTKKEVPGTSTSKDSHPQENRRLKDNIQRIWRKTSNVREAQGNFFQEGNGQYIKFANRSGKNLSVHSYIYLLGDWSKWTALLKFCERVLSELPSYKSFLESIPLRVITIQFCSLSHLLLLIIISDDDDYDYAKKRKHLNSILGRHDKELVTFINL